MPFTSFKTSSQILRQYDIQAIKKDFIAFKQMQAPARLVEDIDFTLNNVDYNASEIAICESLIYPVLVQLWKPFLDTLVLHSHRSWQVEGELTGIPDYLISAASKYGIAVIETPVLVAVEAKKDNFEEGWGQCAAEMIAAQLVNQNKNLTIYGIVSSGEQWQFAKLHQAVFTQSVKSYSIFELDKLYSVLYAVLEDCKKQITG
ncbi:MAG: hypothetical protein RLZZ628_867 [Bacteroidota bacterium]|jgi:hypothetical protein